MTRDEARKLGLLEYQPDHPCLNGHTSMRLVSNNRCRQCQKEWVQKYEKCEISGCERNAHWTAYGSKGICHVHRLRLMRHGDALGGGQYRNVALKWLLDHVGHKGEECLFSPYGGQEAKSNVDYEGKKIGFYRLMCILKNGEPPTSIHEAAHSCGRRVDGCVNPNHLRWATPSENAQDKFIHGTHIRGEEHNLAKLTEDEVREIRGLIGVLPHKEIAETYNVTATTVSNIKNGDSWGWLDDYAYPDPVRLAIEEAKENESIFLNEDLR